MIKRYKRKKIQLNGVGCAGGGPYNPIFPW